MNLPKHGADMSAKSRKCVLYQLNPLYGGLVTSLTMDTESVFNVACEAGGQLFMFTLGDESEFLLSIASMP